MNKFRFILASLAAILLLGGCELFTDTVEYHVTGGPSSITVLYADKGGDLNKVTASSPWSESFTLMNSNRPFITYLRVTNNGVADVQFYITVDGYQETTPVTVASGGTESITFVVE